MITKKIVMKGSWEIKAPRNLIYEIISDFENMPKNFPTVAHSLKIVSRDNNNLIIEAVAKSFGKLIPVTMETTLIPQKGYTSNNTNRVFKATGHEELLMEDTENGTVIKYLYEYDLSKANILLRIIAKPLFNCFSMWYWKRAFIDRIKIILNCK
jgi:carbon monoxide dehydrogenase subunit G